MCGSAKRREMLTPESTENGDPSGGDVRRTGYTTQEESNGLTVTAGVGVDYRVNPAGIMSGGGFQVTTGIVLSLGDVVGSGHRKYPRPSGSAAINASSSSPAGSQPPMIGYSIIASRA